MKPHEIVSGYKGLKIYGEVARFATTLAKQGKDKDEIVAAVEAQYGKPGAGLQKRAPLAIYGTVGVDIEHTAVDQISTALKLPIAQRGALMPDAHPGYALPIGGVVAYHRALAPFQVGVDIGCRMHLSLYDYAPDVAMQERTALLDTLESVTVFGTGNPAKPVADHPILHDPRWKATPFLVSLYATACQQIGTSGGGNHFAEIVIGTWHDGTLLVGLLTHSGSRRVGYDIATRYARLAERETKLIAHGIPKNYGWLSLDSEVGQEYLHAMTLAGDYARANHEVIHRRFAERAGLRVLETIQNHHNFAWIDGDSVIHRKGATPAEHDVLGIIPGSMGTPSYIVRGLGHPDSLCSASHGAGRIGSRTEAKRTISAAEVEQCLKAADVIVRGASLDESPQAYKDIDQVIAYQVDAGLIETVATMRPIAVIMAGD